MNVLPDRGESTGEIRFIPGQGTIYTVGNCPATVYRHVAIPKVVEAKIN